MDRSILREILKLFQETLLLFTNNSIMLMYLETQPIQEISDFLFATITYAGIYIFFKSISFIYLIIFFFFLALEISRNPDSDDYSEIFSISLQILAIMCASKTHWMEAFQRITSFDFDINKMVHIYIIIQLTKVYMIGYI